MTNIVIDKAITAQLTLMEAIAYDAYRCIKTAKDDLEHHNRNTAIGGLLPTENYLESLKILYQAILTIDQNSHTTEYLNQ